MDVHQDSVVVCILKTREQITNERKCEAVDKEIKVFGAFPDDLAQILQWVESEGCHHVAMESTGVYWQPIFKALEDATDGEMEIHVVNARHMKMFRTRKPT